MQSLHVKISPAIPGPQEMKPQYQWIPDDLQTLESYFEQKVAAPPYRQSSLYGFTRLFNVPPYILKDLIQIIRLEMKPDMCKSMGLHFNAQLSLRATFSQLPIIPLGAPAVVNTKNKLLFFVSLFR
jgi:mediator of RNA polymerase II transcription subunit 14